MSITRLTFPNGEICAINSLFNTQQVFFFLISSSLCLLIYFIHCITFGFKK